MRCPNCKKNTMRSWEGPMEVGGVTIMARGDRCSSCGETTFDYEEVGRQEQLVADAYVSRGIRKGAEFKAVRKAAGFKAADLAALLDVRPETVSRWERDEVEIPRVVAFALAELYEHPKDRKRLDVFAS